MGELSFVLHNEFYEIADEAFDNYQKLKKDLEEYDFILSKYKKQHDINPSFDGEEKPLYFSTSDYSHTDFQKSEATRQYVKSAITTICFSAICLESFINYYGIRNLKGSEWQKIKGNKELTTALKWKIIFLQAKELKFPVDSEAYKRLVELFHIRNSIVHYKSLAIKDFDFVKHRKQYEYESKKLDRNICSKAEYCFKTVGLFFDKLQEIDDDPNTRVMIPRNITKLHSVRTK